MLVREEVAALQVCRIGPSMYAVGVQWPTKAYLSHDCRLGITQGGKEPGEDNEAAIRRELEEELGQREGVQVLGRLCIATYQPKFSSIPKSFTLMLVTTGPGVYPRADVVADFKWCAGSEALFWSMAHMSSEKAKMVSRGLACAVPLLPNVPLVAIYGDLMSL